MWKFLKSQPAVFVAMLVMTLLVPLLDGHGHERWANRLEAAEQRDQQERGSRRERAEREPQREGADRSSRELRGVVKEVDRERGRIVVELSGRDSERFGGKKEKTIRLSAETEICRENNDRGDRSSIVEGAPVKVKVDANSISANDFEVEATRVKLSIACKDGQGCPKNGECERHCKSDACTCPMPKRDLSSRP